MISIHAPAKGATPQSCRKPVRSVFQSTLPRRERRKGAKSAPHRQISIHAPAKGATACRPYPRHSDGISIHAPAKGATLFSLACLSLLGFQSTLPRRERPYHLAQLVYDKLFQSTLPRRERPFPTLTISPCDEISIHAPAKGATLLKLTFLFRYIFQSTLPRRERPSSAQAQTV